MSRHPMVQRLKNLRKRIRKGFVREAELRQLIGEMTPEWPRDVIRIGGDRDGGYVIPHDLDEISYCFSPGVGPSARFELELQQRFGIPSYLADFSVDCPPDIDPSFFTKAFVGPRPDDDRFIDLKEWVEANAGMTDGDLMLQMDIEGGEYEVICNADPGFLKRFRLLIVEFHDLHRLDERRHFKRFASTIRRLLPHFRVVHIHPNNNGPVRRVGNIECPSLLEITFARRDREYKPADAPTVPHALDRKNVSGPDVVLPRPWRGRAKAKGLEASQSEPSLDRHLSSY